MFRLVLVSALQWEALTSGLPPQQPGSWVYQYIVLLCYHGPYSPIQAMIIDHAQDGCDFHKAWSASWNGSHPFSSSCCGSAGDQKVKSDLQNQKHMIQVFFKFNHVSTLPTLLTYILKTLLNQKYLFQLLRPPRLLPPHPYSPLPSL